MEEDFVVNLLRQELESRELRFNDISKTIDKLRNNMAIETRKSAYFTMQHDKEAYEKIRRELRGEMSALRQAIKKLEDNDD